MKSSTSSSASGTNFASHDHEADYSAFLASIELSRDNAPGQLFQTDAANNVNLFSVFLDNLPGEQAVHTCNTCRHFFERFGGLVIIGEDGSQRSPIWDMDKVPPFYGQAVEALATLAKKAKVVNVFYPKLPVLGTPVTGRWSHISLSMRATDRKTHGLLTAFQLMAEKHEDFINITRALGEFKAPLVAQVVTLLETDSLYRSEKVIGPAKFLHNLHVARDSAKGAKAKANVVWRAVASAPSGFLHPRASMVGTLLEDLAGGATLPAASARFAAKMAPLSYQRPKAAPTAGTLAQAEKIVAQLNSAGTLRRRFAKLEDLTLLWSPPVLPAPTPKGGVFAHLSPRTATEVRAIETDAVTITWDKFRRTVLPNVKSLLAYVGTRNNFIALLTAADPEATPIIQWDLPEARNPVSWYVYPGGSTPTQWGLTSHEWVPVTGITPQPNMLSGDGFNHQGQSIIFLLRGCVDSKESGNGLFPEILRAEYHGIRSVIEAHSRATDAEGRTEANACGLQMHSEAPVILAADLGNGVTARYKIDRLD